MKLTIVIVNYNVKYYLYQCLHSAEKAIKGMDAEIVVVDNHSKDGSINYLKPKFPNVKFIESKHNLGFAKANNIAIRESQSEYVLLLNPDTFIGEDVLHECISFMDTHKDAGGVGVKMLKTDGGKAMESRRGLPTPMVSFYKMSGLCKKFPNSKRFGRYYMSGLSWTEVGEIDVISGAFCLLRKSVLNKIGLLDESFFMYGEDIDLSYRVIKNGTKNYYLPHNILHYKGESTEKTSFKYVHVFYDAMLIFFKKHYGAASFWICLPIKIAIFIKAFIALFQMGIRNMKKALGFFAPKKQNNSNFVCVANANEIAEMKAILNRNALTATSLIGTEHSLPQGHTKLDLLQYNGKNVTIVYSINAYSYKNILNIFENNSKEHIKIGIYHPEIGVIITENEIIE